MSDEAIAVFTSRSEGEILQAGGSQSWILDLSRAKKAKYLICVRNRNGEHYDQRPPLDDWAHGAVMMVAPITGIIKAPEMLDSQPERWMICFEQYSAFDKTQNASNVWKELENPVQYTTLEEMGIKLADLKFHNRSDSVSGTEVI